MTMQTLGEENVFAAVLETAKQAERLRRQGNPVVYCPVCKADTVEKDGACVWCKSALGGDAVARSGGDA